MSLPLVHELQPPPRVEQAIGCLADRPRLLLFDSALPDPQLGRYSFLTSDPIQFETAATADLGLQRFARLQSLWERYRCDSVADLPPFQAGVAGMLGYEMGGAFERVPRAAANEFEVPLLAAGLYDWVLAWDHQQDRAWLLAHGLDAESDRGQPQAAADRIRQVCGWLERVPQAFPSHGPPLSPARLCPQYPAPGPDGLTSNFTRPSYLDAVKRVQEYIRAGDIFQANLSQRLLTSQQHSIGELYLRLRRENPAPFAGLFVCDDWAIASASPERFVWLDGDELVTRPIKGTRQRQPTPEADLFTRDELRQSTKDQAENVMIVDLLRNDLSRVCRPGSIRVPQLCGVETYRTVQHLVSEVRGQLTHGRTAWDVFPAVFPGGSITGAPKVRAMEIIAELEPTCRGPYCGSLFYVGFNGRLDSNILIRTFTARRGWVQCPVGGGIVAQSDPVDEYLETLHKAEGMLRALAEGSESEARGS